MITPSDYICALYALCDVYIYFSTLLFLLMMADYNYDNGG